MKRIEHDEIKLRIGDMLFTWDDEKERINIRKHGIDFTATAAVFLDDYAAYNYIRSMMLQAGLLEKLCLSCMLSVLQ